MRLSIVCICVVGIVLIVALALKGDVKASFKMFGSGFSIETTGRK